MKDFKKLRKRALELTKKSCDDKDGIRKISKAKSPKGLAFALLDMELAEEFARTFSIPEIKKFWDDWATADYKKYSIDFKEFKAVLKQLDEQIAFGRRNGLSISEMKDQNDTIINQVVQAHLVQLEERKKVHERMIDIIKSTFTDKLDELEITLAELEDKCAKLTSMIDNE